MATSCVRPSTWAPSANPINGIWSRFCAGLRSLLAMRGRTARVLVQRLDAGGNCGRAPDEVIVEEPLEIRLDGHLVTTTMRTPGNDFELAVGLCFTDGLLDGAPVLRCRY